MRAWQRVPHGVAEWQGNARAVLRVGKIQDIAVQQTKYSKMQIISLEKVDAREGDSLGHRHECYNYTSEWWMMR